MPQINPSLVPTVSPGNLFSRLTSDPSLAIRWLTSVDPVYFEAWNRPLADEAMRQLIIAKSLDQVSLRLGHQTYFPFLVQPVITGGMDVPLSWIWDVHSSVPAKWENLRLARIKRVSGSNPGGSGGSEDYTGTLRLVFTANQSGSTTEVALFTLDYDIGSTLTYQRVDVVVSTEETINVDPSEADTISGFAIFRTLDLSDSTVQSFLDFVEPPTDTTDSDSDGEFDNPAVYTIIDSSPGVFGMAALPHGTGVLVDSASNSIPDTAAQIASWVSAFNYPFRYTATRKSTSPVVIEIPAGLFYEFDITAPAGDEPDGDTSGTYYPVWISRVVREDVSADTLTFYFATYAIVDENPSTAPVEFATLTLERTFTSGQVVEIESIDNLYNVTGTNSDLFNQHFGRGHVMLSSLWGGTGDTVTDFFDAFLTIVGDPAQIEFVSGNSILSSYGISRVPKYVPTLGENQALKGSSATREDNPTHPSDDNRYVTQDDQGLGDRVDFESISGISSNADIERYGYKGGLVCRKVKLIVNSSGTSHNYEDDVLPRLRCLLGRDPIFGDEYWDGTRWFKFNGDTWTG
ncbi:MAG: hypothetical protein GF411_14255 [Candidatus Lokiarchaeota archaeon]|nr:hypothetical protein [Candidatus Lokiarchaeota archaeon]